MELQVANAIVVLEVLARNARVALGHADSGRVESRAVEEQLAEIVAGTTTEEAIAAAALQRKSKDADLKKWGDAVGITAMRIFHQSARATADANRTAADASTRAPAARPARAPAPARPSPPAPRPPPAPPPPGTPPPPPLQATIPCKYL